MRIVTLEEHYTVPGIVSHIYLAAIRRRGETIPRRFRAGPAEI